MKLFLLSLVLLIPGVRAEPAVPRLLGHWDFDETANGRVPDRSGHGRDGRIHGTPASVDGIAGKALRFRSNDDYVDFGAPIIPAQDFTISVWVNCDDTDKQFFLGQYRYGHPRRLDLAVREGCVRIQINDIIDSPKLIQPRTWCHLVYARSGGNLTTYLNGRMIAQGRLPAEVTQTENLMVGKIVVPGQDSFRLTGCLDELQIWNGVLSPAEIEANFARTRGAGLRHGL